MKKKLSTICAAACVAFASFALGCASSGYVSFAPTAAFSDDIMFTAKILGGRAQYAYERMTDIIGEVDKQVSLSRADSDLSLFNAANEGTAIEVGKYCYELFKLGREYYELTGGAFNPAAAPLSELWHVDAKSIAALRPDAGDRPVDADLPTLEEVNEVRSYCDPTLVTAEERDGGYYLTKTDARVKLDFGGIAKGYAVDKCAEILREYDISSALIDISGNAYFYGDYIDGGVAKDWNVGILSPRPRAGETLASRGYAAAFSTQGNVSAVTSGDYMRYYVCDVGGANVYIPHIIGADGAPVGVEYSGGAWRNRSEWVVSATVIAESSAACDAFSTAVCALGLTDGARLLQNAACKGLIFTEKRFTIIGGVELYRPDAYDGYREYEQVDASELFKTDRSAQ